MVGHQEGSSETIGILLEDILPSIWFLGPPLSPQKQACRMKSGVDTGEVHPGLVPSDMGATMGADHLAATVKSINVLSRAQQRERIAAHALKEGDIGVLTRSGTLAHVVWATKVALGVGDLRGDSIEDVVEGIFNLGLQGLKDHLTCRHSAWDEFVEDVLCSVLPPVNECLLKLVYFQR
ncbi:hypothetical protein BDR04DRAFT_1139234 [Suillus decipiens]|nr:hypothetical protein BDR04DRAFT_1139234 [Suillus decipiens]